MLRDLQKRRDGRQQIRDDLLAHRHERPALRQLLEFLECRNTHLPNSYTGTGHGVTETQSPKHEKSPCLRVSVARRRDCRALSVCTPPPSSLLAPAVARS